jgi:hypothetical protein
MADCAGAMEKRGYGRRRFLAERDHIVAISRCQTNIRQSPGIKDRVPASQDLVSSLDATLTLELGSEAIPPFCLVFPEPG